MHRWLIALVCIAALGCTEKLCDPGTVGCPCLADSTCRPSSELLCMSGTCVRPSALCEGDICAPGAPKCYTPCTTDVLTEDGSVRACSAEGLMDGCIGSAVCDHGSCVPVGRTMAGLSMQPGMCGAETDCPDHQTCIEGRCFSNCDFDADCKNERVCQRHVCRRRCGDDNPCGDDGYACNFTGACVPLVPPEPITQPVEEGSFTIAFDRFAFNTNLTETTLAITNLTTSRQTLLVRKTEEQIAADDGTATRRLASKGEAPLFWLTMGVGTAAQVQSFPVTIAPGGTAEIVLSGAKNANLPRWRGAIEIGNEALGIQRVDLTYSERVKGRWSGRVYYFGNFEEGNATGASPIDVWRANRTDLALLDRVPNAFLQAWGRFRNNQFSSIEMDALLQSTITESWKFDRVKELCREAGFGANAVCAPFGGVGSASVIPYTSAANINRVPSGVIELDFVMNLEPASFEEQADPTLCGRAGLTAGSGEHCFVGRVQSNRTLQYAGDPTVHLRFEADPLECQSEGAAGCASYLADFFADVRVGARYVPELDDQTCALADGLERKSFPWLVPGFGAPGGGAEKTECRERLVPFSGDIEHNTTFAGANPIPDGRLRQRRLELVDGMMIEQKAMLLILRETVDAFHGGEPFSSYAFVRLVRDDVDPEPAEYQGNRADDDRALADGALDVGCTADLISTVTRRPRSSIDQLTASDRNKLALAVTTGATSTAAFTVFDPSVEKMHYVCVWNEDSVVQSQTGEDVPRSQVRQVFDAGANGATSCPVGALVVYFAAHEADFGGSELTQDSCNTNANGAPETCLARLKEWVSAGRRIRLMQRDRSQFPGAPSTTTFDLNWTCTPDDMVGSPGDPPLAAVPVSARAACEDNRFDMRAQKSFFAQDDTRVFFNPIETDIHQAFRYRTQFVSRANTNVGFAPDLCRGNGVLTPYCYDTTAIEAIAERVECAVELYHHDLDNGGLSNATAETLLSYLRKNFAVLQIDNPTGDPILQQGFERLSAELLITLGDDAYTSSFASRFDLAGSKELAFEGSRFEAGGIDVSGGVGYELYRLYQATQYYEMVLDRFYRLAPLFWDNIQRDASERYVTQATVTTYLDRIIRASAQLASASSEIARRYQNLNRSDLARAVVERAYTRSYQESSIISALMTAIAAEISPRQADQIIIAIDDAQRRFRVAMLDMQSRYLGLDEQLNPFGFLPDYVPFPALDEGDVNGIEPMFERANRSLSIAAEQEQKAIESNRESIITAEEFQGDLLEIANGYRERLGQICGNFVASDGRVYPAIPRYAHLSSDLAGLDDPCGATKTGEIWLKGADIETRALELQRVRNEIANILERAAIAEQSVAKQCDLIDADVRLFLETQGVVDGYQNTIDGLEFTISQLDKILDFTKELAERIEGIGDAKTLADIFKKITELIIYGASAIVHFAVSLSLDAVILSNQIKIRNLERTYQEYQIGRQCDYLTAELAFTVREIHLDMNLAELDALNAIWNVQVDTQLLAGLDSERRRVTSEWDDAQQLAINAAAANSDPNVRIYKNNAIINADRSFDRAMRDAYRATKIYEYYTSQSYAGLDKLYLVRAVDVGDINLRSYIAELEDAFFDYEEQFGNPDTRIALVSLRDDIFRIPRYALDGTGRPLTAADRAKMFRERLQNPYLVDDEGFINVHFTTGFGRLSPLTHNHKILFMEVEFFGDAGDDVARIYVRQKGTGVVRTSDEGRLYYTLPPRTAVINPVVNGARSFGQDSDGAIAGATRSIFRSYRFRERPFVNTNWELVLNMRTEAANEDVNLDGLDDIVLYVFYTDFTTVDQ